LNILDALSSDQVFAKHFRGPTWDAWRVFLAALFGLLLTHEQLALYQQHTGRTYPPTTPHREAWPVIGRRGGKSFVPALIAVFLAVFKDWRPHLGPGEVGTIMVVCADRRQARVIMRYALGLLKAVPMLARQIESTTRESITLKRQITIEVHTSSFKTVRGYAIVAALLDEISFWEVDENAASPDVEVINAIKPAMATIPNAMLLCASSPHSRRGALWDAYRKHFGKDADPVLVWQAATRDMNPSVPQAHIDEHMADDPARASAEYMATFRTDLESLVQREVIEACVAWHVYERPPLPGVSVAAFVDPSGGSSDSMTLCIAHAHDQGVVIDAIREARPPFSPEEVVSEFCATLKTYTCYTVHGDRCGGEWPREMFRRFGVNYEVTDKPKSQLYTDLVPLLNSRRVDLLDHSKTVNQLVALERHVGRSGRDLIDHPPNAHDDCANALAGAVALCHCLGGYDVLYQGFQEDADTKPVEDDWHAERKARYHTDLARYARAVALPLVRQPRRYRRRLHARRGHARRVPVRGGRGHLTSC
jgi:hypothetical protein